MCWRDYSILCVFGGDILNSAKNAPNVKIPVWQFVSSQDETVPPDEGKKLHTYFTGTKDKKLIVLEGKVHNDFEMNMVISEGLK